MCLSGTGFLICLALSDIRIRRAFFLLRKNCVNVSKIEVERRCTYMYVFAQSDKEKKDKEYEARGRGRGAGYG